MIWLIVWGALLALLHLANWLIARRLRYWQQRRDDAIAENERLTQRSAELRMETRMWQAIRESIEDEATS